MLRSVSKPSTATISWRKMGMFVKNEQPSKAAGAPIPDQ